MENQFDVIVVGAGYVGSCVAYHLSTAGLKTALFDRGLFAATASRANFGNIQIQDMETGHSADMIRRGVKKFETLEQELDWKVGLRRIGGLIPIENENQLRLMKERSEIVRAAGFTSELISAQTLKEVEPLMDTRGLLGALYNENEGQVDPFQFIWAHLTRGRQRRLKEFYHVEVTGFIVNGGRMQGVRTIQGDFFAGKVVLCTGAHTKMLGQMLGRDWDSIYILGQALVTEPVAQTIAGHVSSASFFEPADQSHEKGHIGAVLALSQSGHGHLLLGEAEYEADHFRQNVPYASLPAIVKTAVRYYPCFGKLRVLRCWSAPVASTSDSCPLLGPVPGLEDLILATAFRSTVVISPLVGETITQLITRGNCDLDITSFLPERNNRNAH